MRLFYEYCDRAAWQRTMGLNRCPIVHCRHAVLAPGCLVPRRLMRAEGCHALLHRGEMGWASAANKQQNSVRQYDNYGNRDYQLTV